MQRVLTRVVPFSDFWRRRLLLKLLAALWGALGSFWVVSGGSLVGSGVLLVALGRSWGLLLCVLCAKEIM